MHKDLLNARTLASQTLISALQDLAQAGQNPVTAVLQNGTPVPDAHYPAGDLVDTSSGFRYYYHCHAASAWKRREHGHFHLFRESGDHFHHLVAISADTHGLPVRAFTTNRWVTGESWRHGDTVQKDLDTIQLPADGPFVAVNRYLVGLIGLFRDNLHRLITARDQRLLELGTNGRSRDRILEDRRIHVLSQTPLNLLESFDAVD